MTNLPADCLTIAAKLEEVAGDPLSTTERMRDFLLVAAGVLRDLALIVPGQPDLHLDKIDPEGTA